MPITQTSLLLNITVTTTAKSKQYVRIKHIDDSVNPGSEVGKEALNCEDDEKYDMFSSCITLVDVSIFEAAELDAIALLADAWDNDLGREVSAQLVQANVRPFISFRKEKGESRGEGKFPVRSTRLPLSDRRQQLKELRGRTEWYACGR